MKNLEQDLKKNEGIIKDIDCLIREVRKQQKEIIKSRHKIEAIKKIKLF